MSAAATLPATEPKKGRKKIVIIALAVVLLLAAAAGGFMVFKSRAAHADDEDEVEVEAPRHAKGGHKGEAFDPKHVPVFAQVEPITVNLADRDIDRYAQVVITLELEGDKAGEQVKAFMPAIRNNLLMAVANKTSDDVRTDEGRRLLAAELQVQALRPLGFDLDAEDLLDNAAAHAGSGKGRKSRKPARLPIKAVHFVNFIVQ